MPKQDPRPVRDIAAALTLPSCPGGTGACGTHGWRWVVVNSSGGKDSQTALHQVVLACQAAGYPMERLVVSHQHLGHSEWPGTLDLVRRQADHYGLRLEISAYRNLHGEELSLLDYVRKRRKWPDSKNRFCTSEFKRGPGGRVLVKLFRETAGNILNVYGFRSDESTARARRQVFCRNARFSSGSREVWDWLPIHGWSAGEVWESIRRSGVPSADAYRLGMPRLSCVFCIFAPPAALALAGKHNPELLDAYCALEEELGHTFQNGRSLRSVRDTLRLDLEGGDTVEDWCM